MQHFTDVRSFGDLTQYGIDFSNLDKAAKLLVIDEMIVLIAKYKEKEAQTDLFEPKDLKLVGKAPRYRARRTRTR